VQRHSRPSSIFREASEHDAQQVVRRFALTCAGKLTGLLSRPDIIAIRLMTAAVASAHSAACWKTAVRLCCSSFARSRAAFACWRATLFSPPANSAARCASSIRFPSVGLTSTLSRSLCFFGSNTVCANEIGASRQRSPTALNCSSVEARSSLCKISLTVRSIFAQPVGSSKIPEDLGGVPRFNLSINGPYSSDGTGGWFARSFIYSTIRVRASLCSSVAALSTYNVANRRSGFPSTRLPTITTFKPSRLTFP
jgi:hypothetical protein